MATYRIRRQEVKPTLDLIASRPWRVFSATGTRRTDVYLRYSPLSMTDSGTIAREGDHVPLNSPGRGDPHAVYDANGQRHNLMDPASNRRKGKKITLQAAGELRTMIAKNYDHSKGNQSVHAKPVTGKGRSYDPLDHDLFPLAGFYSDDVKVQPSGEAMIARFGAWRPYTMVCMRGVVSFRALGHEWIVVDPPQTDPIQYRSEAEFEYSLEHVVTASGTSHSGRGLIASPEAWEIEMKLV